MDFKLSRYAMYKDVDQLLSAARKGEFEFVDFRFTDIQGQTHHITYRAKYLSVEQVIKGIGFDGSSISGWKPINESDMLMVPDITTAFMDPFAQYPTLCLICNIVDPQDGGAYDRDPRSIAQKTVEYAIGTGVADQIFVGPELEFFVFDDIKFATKPHSSFYSLDSQEGPHNSEIDIPGGNLGYRPQLKGGYFPVQPIDSLANLRADMCDVMEEIGLKCTLHHHEVANAQCEIGIEYSNCITSADNVQKFKYAVKNVAFEQGKTATFMPKPVLGDNGSGMHTHISLWKDGVNLFYSEQGYANLSDTALYFIGGIIHHAKAINAFSNPSTNSYKRLVPGYEAPVHLAYSAKNRSASIRIPHVHGRNAKRIEMRFPDPSCNPYLSFAVLILAGIDGIKNKLHPGAPRDENLYEMDAALASTVPAVAGSLREALDCLDQDRIFLTCSGAFDDEFIDNYIKLKMEEVKEFEMAPHPVEFKLYYSC